MISIIIPCYNAEETIRATLRSVYEQSCQDFEIIAINDGSTDGTLKILEEEAHDKENFKVIDIPNCGVSNARNIGINEAQGEYLYFLDSDDRILPELMENIQQERDFDLLIFGYIQTSKDRNFLIRPVPCADYLKSYLESRIKIVMCSIVFRTAFVRQHKILFDTNTAYSEDREFIIKSLLYANDIKQRDYIGFHYIIRGNSAMSKTDLTLKRLTSLDALERSYKLLEHTDYSSAMLAYFKTSIYLIDRMSKLRSTTIHPEAQEYLDQFKDRYCGNNIKLRLNRYGLYTFAMDIAYNLRNSSLVRSFKTNASNH